MPRVRLPAHPAAQQAAQQVLAPHSRRPLHLRSTRVQALLHRRERLTRDQRGPCVLHPNRLSGLLVPALHAPHRRPRVRLVRQQVVQTILVPPLPPVADAPVVQLAADLLQTVAPQRTLEYLLHHPGGIRVDLQRGTLLHSIAHLDSPVAEGRTARQEVAPGRCLPHAPDDLLRKILAVELVHGLDDGLHQLASGSVVRVLGDGDDADTPLPEHRLEGHRVLPLAREPTELPYEDHVERRLGAAARLDHLSELRPVCHASALGLVDVLADDDEAVALRVLAQGAELRRDGEVDVLSIAGDPRVDGCWCVGIRVVHGRIPRRSSYRLCCGLSAAYPLWRIASANVNVQVSLAT